MPKLADLRKLLEEAQRRAPPAAGSATPANATGVRSPPAARAAATTRPAETVPAESAVARRALAAGKHGDGDVDLAAAFADVKRLPPTRRARIVAPRAVPIARQRIADDLDALAASKYSQEAEPQMWEVDWEVGTEREAGQTFRRPGIGEDVLAKLRRGQWTVQAELDLHGYTSDDAHDGLADFLDAARARGLRCVRVIHGKGLTSPNREPVLKGRVRRWLSQWDDVLAYAEASANAGGGGAVVVLLRGR